MSPLSKIRETRGFVTKKRVNDVPEQKAMHSAVEYNRLGFKYEQPLAHVFRDTKAENVLAFNQKDFVLSSKPNKIDNPHGLSEFDKLPKFHSELQRQREAVWKEKEGLSGKTAWERNNPRNHRYVPMAT